MKFIFNGYDLTLAIAAQQTLLYEFTNYSNEDRMNLVFTPVQKFLQEMATDLPKQITCFFGNQFKFPNMPGCSCRCVYLIDRRGRVVYLGTVFNPEAVAQYRARLPEKDVEFLSTKKVSRGRLLHCVIPTQKEEIDEIVIVESARKFFQSFPAKTHIPELAKALVGLLCAETGAKLEGEILKQARHLAKSVSRKQELKKFMEDMVW